MLKAISPLDGRYYERTAPLGDYFSEFALMGARVWVELQFLLALDPYGIFPPLNKRERSKIEKMAKGFSPDDYTAIKKIEAELNHDVKACELYLQETLGLRHPNRIHFGLTSEDVNNIAYTLLLKKYRDERQLPRLRELLNFLADKIEAWRSIPIPARTHGQMASPTTAGKELAVYAERLLRRYKELKNLKFRAKCNGATGNYSAFTAAAPGTDWQKFAANFIESLDLEMNPATTQIEDHDSWADYFYLTRMINGILLDLDRDMWMYLMLGYFRQKNQSAEVGSSTMPHKVNPINFENSEGNLGIANALLDHFIAKLPNSRLQRDLSDSTVERNFGVALGHGDLGLGETLHGLAKVDVNREYCVQELNAYPELLAEPIQTILRREGFEKPYEMLKNLTRGNRLTVAELNKFIDSLKISDELRRELTALRSSSYTGLAEAVCSRILAHLKKVLGNA
ncbi:MAG: adenylosuccinate lyase [Candidatus Neomarinimicrobiota bacterium]|jgi:adenylosuccinate lyase